jgi:mTERF domain-containing protein
MQVIGPRHSFLTSKGLEGKLVGTSGSREVALDLSALVAGADVEFVDSLGASINEYEGFRTAFEEEYTAQLSRDAAKEFQDELKKLGIYEGA